MFGIADPVEHAARHYEALAHAADAREFERAAVEGEITATLTRTIRTAPAASLVVPGTLSGREHSFPVTEAVADTVQSGRSLDALMQVLADSPRPTVARLRAVIAQEWVERQGDEVADLRSWGAA